MQAIFFLLLISLAQSAFAIDFFTPPPGDISLSMLLQPIFGSIFGGEGDGPLGSSIRIFNVACLTIGGFLAAYTFVVGTMQTAHDGEMLGKKWSSMWIPIRVAIGTASIVPIGSFCAAQMLVGWLAMQGVGLADAVWKEFTQTAIASPGISSAAAPVQNVSRLAFGMLRSQVCMKGFAKLHADSHGMIFTAPPDASGSEFRRYGVRGMSKTQCGGVVMSQADAGMLADAANSFGINTGAAEQAKAIRSAHASAAAALEGDLAPIADAIVAGQGADAQSTYIAAIYRYQKSIGEAAKSQRGDKRYFDEMAKNASNEGWILAGAWFMRLIALEDSLMKALADAPTSMPVEGAESMSSDMDRFYSSMAGAVRDPSVTGLDNQLVADRARADSESGIIMSALNTVFNKITDASTAGFNFLSGADIERHPMLVASDAGHTLINWSIGLSVASIIAARVGGFTVAMVLGALVLSLLAAGVTLSYVLPMLPMIIFIGAAAGWLLMVLEAVVGAPLWAVAHLNPRGEEFHGGASAGYMLILELSLKPVLMIFGFCFAVLVSMPLGQLINKIFIATFTLNQGGFVGFIGMLAAVGIYASLMLVMLRSTFGFIHKVPDQVMKWMGGGHSSGLADAGGTAAAVEHQSGAVTGAIAGAVTGAASNRLGAMAQRSAVAGSGQKAVMPRQKPQATQLADQLAGKSQEFEQSRDAAVADAFDGNGKDDNQAQAGNGPETAQDGRKGPQTTQGEGKGKKIPPRA